MVCFQNVWIHIKIYTFISRMTWKLLHILSRSIESIIWWIFHIIYPPDGNVLAIIVQNTSIIKFWAINIIDISQHYLLFCQNGIGTLKRICVLKYTFETVINFTFQLLKLIAYSLYIEFILSIHKLNLMNYLKLEYKWSFSALLITIEC